MFLKALRNLFRQRGSANVLLRASILYKKAADEAEENYRKTGHRYFVIYDPAQRKLITLTYDLYRYRPDSYVYLTRRGRFPYSLTRNEFK